MIGDTTYDIDMAKAASVASIGVGWGYHGRDALGHADRVIEDFSDLPMCLNQLWETA